MGSSRGGHRPAGAARIAAYLAVIALPTLVLLVLGLQSVRQRYEAMDVLAEKYGRLSLERIADTFEQRLRELAAKALHDPELAGVLPLVSQPPGPENQHAIRAIVRRVAGRHPIASRLILYEGRAVRFPSTMWKVDETIDTLLAAADGRARIQFEAARAEEGRAVAGLAHFEQAAAAYQRCADLPVARRLKAIALAGAARCHLSAREPRAAAAAWRKVAERYGDEYSLSSRPFGLVAGLERYALPAAGETRVERDDARALKEDLAGGRWEVSAQLADYYMARLGELEARRAGGDRADGSAFLAHLKLAARVARGFDPPEPITADVGERAIRLDDGLSHPFLYASLGPAVPPSAGVTAVLVIDRAWAGASVLPLVAGIGAAAPPPQLVPAGSRSRGAADEAGSNVGLRGAFEGWALAPSNAGRALTAGRREFLLFGGATALVLGVLLLGNVLVMRDAARQREMARLRADFVSGVSHQLRTPLALIRLYSEMLTDYPDTSEDERRERLGVITSESQRLTTLIDRVLDFSRIERGGRPYVLEPGDLAAAVQPVIEVYAQYLRRRGFSAEVQIESGLPAVRFDRDGVADAVVNLVDNAAKYAGDGKYVLVRVATRDGGTVVIEVADRGPGIPETQRTRLFEAFYRGAHGKEKGGYGLGLFLVRNIMEAHGGRVEIESEPGRGSLFRLVFPVDRSAKS
ncbi:MAG: sensor histidine kinase [Bacteroidales bacterium]